MSYVVKSNIDSALEVESARAAQEAINDLIHEYRSADDFRVNRRKSIPRLNPGDSARVALLVSRYAWIEIVVERLQ